MDFGKLRQLTGEQIGSNLDAHAARVKQQEERDAAIKSLEGVMIARDDTYIALSAIAITHAGVVENESESLIVGTQHVPVGNGEDVVTRNLRAVVRNDFGKTGDAVEVSERFPKTVTVSYALEAKEGDLETGIFRKVEPIGKNANGHTILGEIVAFERFEANKVPAPKTTGTQSSEVLLYGSNTQDIESANRQRSAVEAQLPVMGQTLQLLENAVYDLTNNS
jgi:hypothetical protein